MNDSIFIFFFIFFKNFKVRGRKGVRPAKRFSNRLSVRFGLQGKLDGSTIIQIVLAGTDQASRLTSACLQASVKPRLRSWARSEGTGQNLSHPFDLAYRANRTDARFWVPRAAPQRPIGPRLPCAWEGVRTGRSSVASRPLY